MEGKLFWILSAVSVSFAANIPFFDRSRESDSVRQSIDPANRFLADPIANHYDCSSLSCSESAKIGLESKIQKARRLLRLLEETQNSSPLLKLEGFPKAQPLKRSSLKNDASKDLSFEDYPKDSVTPAKQTTEESPDDESPEKWFIPIEPRPYKSPDSSPETWFRPIVSRPYKSPRDEQLDVPTPIPTELSVDVIQEPEQDSDRAIEATPQKMGKYSNLEKGVFEPITVLALKIFNSLPKPKSKDNELHNKEEWKGVGNRSEKEEEVRDIEEVGGGDSVPESLVNVVVQKSKKADNGKMNNKGLETDFNLKEPSSESSGSMDVDFGDKLSAPIGATASYNTRDGGEKIRFRPRRNYLTQLLRHTQELGLVQKLGDVFSLFPGREEENGHGSSQSGAHLIGLPMWIRRKTAKKEKLAHLSEKSSPARVLEPSIVLQQPKAASLLPRQPPMQIQGQPVDYMHQVSSDVQNMSFRSNK